MTRHSITHSRKPIIFLGFLCISALLGASLWVTLKHGIVIARVDLPSIRAEHFSIRALDGRFIVSIDRLDVLDRTSSKSLSNPELLFARFRKFAPLLQEIRVNRLQYRGHTYRLLFSEDRFKVSGNDFRLIGTVAFQEGKVLLEIAKLEVKPYPVALTGKASYSQESKQLDFSGRFNGPEISGALVFSQQQEQVDVEIETDSFTALPGFLELFSLDPELTSWIAENIAAQDYRVKELRLRTHLRDGKPDLPSASISGSAVATNAAIRFHPSLPPVQCKQIHISFANDRLSFILDEPEYIAKNLSGSSVTINHLLVGQSQMDIHIQTETALDTEVLDLLAAYDIRLPLSQQSGTTRADLHLVFDLPDFTLQAEGTFATDQGTWKWEDILFKADEAFVRLKENRLLIEKAAVAYRDSIMARLAGTIDPASQEAALTADIEHLNLRDREKDIIRVQNLTTPVNIQFRSDEVNISLLMLETNFALSPSRRLVSLDNLSKVKPFIPSFWDVPFQGGKLFIDFTETDNLAFEGFIDTRVLPLSANDQPVTHFSFQGSKTADKLVAMINEGKIVLTAVDTLRIDLRDYLLTVDTDKIGTSAGPEAPVPIVISGVHSLIKLKNISIPTGNFEAELQGKDVTFNAALAQGKIFFESNGLDMTLAASEIDAQIARDFFPFADLEGGRFNLSLKGKDERNFEGFAEFNNVLVRDVVLLNNVLSFINAIPALATLSSPGFDADGYQISQGVVQFSRRNNQLTIQQLRTDGATINTEAEGWVDFDNDSLKINLELISLKDYSKIISKIPWAGYAILGENGSLSTSLLLSGNRHAPEITTNLTEEIVMMPINIVKRTVQWPFLLLGKIKDLATDRPEPDN